MLPCPMVVRGPSGGYVRGGPFHSQNPEAAFLHTPGLKIVYPATASDAKGLAWGARCDAGARCGCCGVGCRAWFAVAGGEGSWSNERVGNLHLRYAWCCIGRHSGHNQRHRNGFT